MEDEGWWMGLRATCPLKRSNDDMMLMPPTFNLQSIRALLTRG